MAILLAFCFTSCKQTNEEMSKIDAPVDTTEVQVDTTNVDSTSVKTATVDTTKNDTTSTTKK